jgi:hypothetical protein
MLFNKDYIGYYMVAAATVFLTGIVANKWKQTMESNTDEYDMIRKYLLTDSPLYGYNRPKLWIHTKYEINARKWKDFYSRNSTDLNEPYLHLTIKTIVDHCAEDFHVCLIDDQSFSKLLPTWDVDLAQMAEPMRTHFRELALAEVLYYYGGMVVPNSFLCLKNLRPMYDEAISGGRAFVCENVNRTMNSARQKHKLLFVPDLYIMGAPKNDPTMLRLVEYLKSRNRSPHFSAEAEFLGDSSQWCLDAIHAQKLNLVGGELVGVKTAGRKTILLENLMEEGYLDLHRGAYGIYVPNEEILKRPKYQWFAVLPTEQVLESRMIVSKYLVASMVDTRAEKGKTIKSVAEI